MSKVLCPGSYDPITLGHINVIERCSKIYDEVVVLVGFNFQKKGILSVSNRVKYIEDALKHLNNIKIFSYDGLIVDFAHENNCDLIVKGIRNSKDLEYENEMAFVNAQISLSKYNKSIETLYIPSSPDFIYTSSTIVRQLIDMKLSIENYVHDPVLLYELLNNNE